MHRVDACVRVGREVRTRPPRTPTHPNDRNREERTLRPLAHTYAVSIPLSRLSHSEEGTKGRAGKETEGAGGGVASKRLVAA